MSKKIIFILFVFVYFLGFKLVNAEVFINEVQISPTEERFIELYNSGNSSVDLTNWYLQRKTATSSVFSSLVSKTYFENRNINAGDYFIVSKDTLGLSTFTLTESNTIQLKNSDQEIVDKIGWGEGESSVASNPPENKSIQKNGSTWIISSPTAGEENASSNSNNSEEGNDENNDNNNEEEQAYDESEESINNKPVIIPVFKSKILTKNPAFAGQPHLFDLEVKYGEDIYACGNYFWNFGDGSSLVQKDNFNKFYHTYLYPGEYLVSVEYYKKSSFLDKPDIYNEMIIKVVPTVVSISKIGDYKDFFIELTNNSDYKIDISGWVLSSGVKIFSFPKNTIIMPKKFITISGKTTSFMLGDEKNLKLTMQTGEVVFDYSTKLAPIKKLALFGGTNINTNNKKSETEDSDQSESDLSAAPVLSKANFGSKFIIIGFISLLGICGVAVYFLRRKRVSSKSTADDFDILDE